MPRFGLKSLLIGITLVALWFSTLAGYAGADDVRAFIMASVLVASGVAAYSHTGRLRAFWMGFVGTLLSMGTRQLFTAYGARFEWVIELSRNIAEVLSVGPPQRGQFVLGINLTFTFGATLVGATFIGLLCMHVYDRAKRNGDRP